MVRLLLFSLSQSFLLAVAQITLKLAVAKLDKFSWTWSFFKSFFMNWPLLLSGLAMITAWVLWLYILKHWPFSIVYPLSAIAYVWGMIAATVLLHEPIAATRWIGVILIVAGAFFIAK